MLETSDARTVFRMMFDIVTIRVIPSLTDSLMSSYPHITTLLYDSTLQSIAWLNVEPNIWLVIQNVVYFEDPLNALANCLAYRQLQLPFLV